MTSSYLFDRHTDRPLFPSQKWRRRRPRPSAKVSPSKAENRRERTSVQQGVGSRSLGRDKELDRRMHGRRVPSVHGDAVKHQPSEDGQWTSNDHWTDLEILSHWLAVRPVGRGGHRQNYHMRIRGSPVLFSKFSYFSTKNQSLTFGFFSPKWRAPSFASSSARKCCLPLTSWIPRSRLGCWNFSPKSACLQETSQTPSRLLPAFTKDLW